MNGLKSNAEIRVQAREQLRGNWGKAILACIIYVVINGVINSIPIVGPIASLFLTGAFTLGQCYFFLRLVRQREVAIEDIFSGFKQYSRSLILCLLTGIFVLLWSLLLIVPGIVASMRYSMAYYILRDHPEMGGLEAINRSKEMMYGHKGRLFMLGLSFIGWALLCILTVGIGFLWLVPYIQASIANFYENLKNYRQSGTITDPIYSSNIA